MAHLRVGKVGSIQSVLASAEPKRVKPRSL